MSFGRLGALGKGFGRMGGGSKGGGVDLLAPGKPSIAWQTTPTSDSTPNVIVTYVTGQGAPLDTVVGDTLRVRSATTGVTYFTRTVTQDDIDGVTGAISGATRLPPIPHDLDCRIERDAGAHVSLWSTAAAGVIEGFIVVGYGQSWMNQYLSGSSSPAAASNDTFYYDPTNGWTSVPNGNGVRALCNGLVAELGVPIGLIHDAHDGEGFPRLSPGNATGYFAQLQAKIENSGVDHLDAIFYHQLQDGNAGTYTTYMDQMHDAIVAITGQTKADVPLVVSGKATVDLSTYTWASDASWQEGEVNIRAAADNLDHVYYSHSNIDAVLSDGLHFTPAYNAISCDRYAQTILFAKGEAASPATFYLDGASPAIGSTTTTTLDVTHAGGTDVTPSSGIKGFEVSGDNGGSWLGATGARTDANTITLTHADAGSGTRKIRYMYGGDPDISAVLKDNSTLGVPLAPTTDDLSAAGSSGFVSTYWTARRGTVNGSNLISLASLNLGNSAGEQLLVIGVMYNNDVPAVTTWTITPSGGSPIDCSTAVVSAFGTGGGNCAIYRGIIPAGVDASNSAMALQLNASPNGALCFGFWTIPTASLLDTAASDSDRQRNTSTDTAQVSLTVPAGACIITVASRRQSNNTFTHDFNNGSTETFTERFDGTGLTDSYAGADISNASSNAASVVKTLVSSAGGTVSIAAACWR